jgi:maleate cis-trans isomerase
MVEPLETDLGIPVVASNQACVWAALQAFGVKEPVYGYGRLLSGS